MSSYALPRARPSVRRRGSSGRETALHPAPEDADRDARPPSGGAGGAFALFFFLFFFISALATPAFAADISRARLLRAHYTRPARSPNE